MSKGKGADMTTPRAIMSRPVVVPGAVPTSMEEVGEVLRARHPDPRRARRHLALARATGVSTRYLSRPIGDLLDPDADADPALGWVREALFELGGRAARQALELEQIAPHQVDVLVTASVSGWMMPALAEHLVNALGLRPAVRRIACAQSGCAGTAVALQRAAEQVTLDPDAVVLVVTAEVFSAGIHPYPHDDSDFIFTALFGDGAAAWVVRGRDPSTPGLLLHEPWSFLLPGSEGRYRLWFEAGGPRFASTPDAPDAVREIAPNLLAWYKSRSAGAEPRIVATHPGGPRIMRGLAEALNLEDKLLARSQQSLADYGNMGATSLADVLSRHFDGGLAPGDAGLIIGLGPGVMCEALSCSWVA
jgi:predicted naringenin-chalcone synthase